MFYLLSNYIVTLLCSDNFLLLFVPMTGLDFLALLIRIKKKLLKHKRWSSNKLGHYFSKAEQLLFSNLQT